MEDIIVHDEVIANCALLSTAYIFEIPPKIHLAPSYEFNEPFIKWRGSTGRYYGSKVGQLCNKNQLHKIF